MEGEIADYRDAHPSAALFVVEVADDSLRRDRTVKRRLYARYGIPESIGSSPFRTRVWRFTAIQPMTIAVTSRLCGSGRRSRRSRVPLQ